MANAKLELQMKLKAQYNTLEQFLETYKDSGKSVEELTEFFNKTRSEAVAGDEVPTPKKGKKATAKEETAEEGLSKAEQKAAAKAEKEAEKAKLLEEKAAAKLKAAEEKAAAKEEKARLKAEEKARKDAEKPAKQADMEITESIKAIIDGPGTKADKIRALHVEGMSNGQITRELQTYYSFVHSTLMRDEMNALKEQLKTKQEQPAEA